ncbi:ABC transporter permease [bacterium]|nr:ABC transporter permease [bacterium]
MQRKRQKRYFTLFLTAFSLPILLFILIPVFSFLFKVSPTDMATTLQEKEVIASLITTFRASLWATFAATLFGIPLAYLLSRKRFYGKAFVEGILDIPIIIPHTAAGIALLSTFGTRSLFGQTTGLTIVGNELGIAIAMFFVSVPFLINTAKEGFNLVDVRYEKVAITLGASPLKAATTIAIPMAKRSIFAGMLLMWGRGVSEFGAVMILAYHPMTAPLLIYDRFESFGLAYARPVTAILVLITLLMFVFFRSLLTEKYDD